MSWTMESLSDLATGYWKSGVLASAVKLNLFAAFEDGPANSETLALKTNSAERHLRNLLDAMVSLNLLSVSNGLYDIESSARDFLSPSGSMSMLGALRYNNDLYPLWEDLDVCVRNGDQVIPKDNHLGFDPEKTRHFVLGMHSRALGMAPGLIPAIPINGHTRLLDVACGPATFSRHLLAANPNLHATAFDLPPILKISEELTQASDVADRMAFHPGDYHNDPLPTGFDAVLYCGALHQESQESARDVFEKIFKALDPGGTALVIDLMTDTSRTAPVMSTLFSLNMLLTSPGGEVFSDSDTMSLMKEVGFTDMVRNEAPGTPYWVISATKA